MAKPKKAPLTVLFWVNRYVWFAYLMCASLALTTPSFTPGVYL